MATYAYRAAHASGQIVKGRMEAANENELSSMLVQSGLELIEASSHKNGALFAGRRLPPHLLAQFFSQLHDLMTTGMPFIESLRALQGPHLNPVLADALNHIIGDVSNGSGIADSFEKFPNLFPSAITSMIRAGEAGGKLEDIFNHIARYK